MSDQAQQIEAAWSACRLTTANPPRTFFAVGFEAGRAAASAETAALLAAERERCAKAAEARAGDGSTVIAGIMQEIASRIRALK